jgi:hypothetical protein
MNGTLLLFPGVTEVAAVPEPEPEIDLEQIVIRQEDLLAQWVDLAGELKRRADVPPDLGFQMNELVRQTDI